MDVVAISLVALLFAPTGQNDELSHQLAKFEEIARSSECSQLNRCLFTAGYLIRIDALMKQRNDSVATKAAWRLIEAEVTLGSDEERIVPANKSKLNWFLGFFEGRTRTTVPKWWRQLILDSREVVVPGPADILIKTVAPGLPKRNLYHTPDLSRLGKHCLRNIENQVRKCPRDALISEQNGVITYSNKEHSIVLPRKLVEQSNDKWNHNICCEFTDRSCFIAIHGDAGWPHLVARVDRETNEIVWSATACGGYFNGPTSGYSESWVSLLPTDDGRLFCFGYASGYLYAHGFDANTGKSIVEFSNSY